MRLVLVVGLGNPGRSYSCHRHNVGFRVLDALGNRHGIDISKRSFGALVGSGAIAGCAALLAKPQTYMNVSGDAVAPLVGYHNLKPQDLIVVHDDLDIDLGHLKISHGAGHGGHNGIRSIIESIGHKDFCRIRVGIGRPPPGKDATDYVLEPFETGEEERVATAIEEASDAVELVLAKGYAVAQQKYH